MAKKKNVIEKETICPNCRKKITLINNEILVGERTSWEKLDNKMKQEIRKILPKNFWNPNISLWKAGFDKKRVATLIKVGFWIIILTILRKSFIMFGNTI